MYHHGILSTTHTSYKSVQAPAVFVLHDKAGGWAIHTRDTAPLGLPSILLSVPTASLASDVRVSTANLLSSSAPPTSSSSAPYLQQQLFQLILVSLFKEFLHKMLLGQSGVCCGTADNEQSKSHRAISMRNDCPQSVAL